MEKRMKINFLRTFRQYLRWLFGKYSYPYLGSLDLTKQIDFNDLTFPLGATKNKLEG